MKKNLSKSIVCLYVAIVVLTIFVGLLLDKTGETGYKNALILCFVGLVITTIASFFNSKSDEKTVAHVDENSYAVINKDVYSINIENQDKDNVVIKLVRKD